MKPKIKITEQEFDKIRCHFSAMKPRNIDGIFQIMVCGRKQVDVAKELEITNRAVSQMVRKAWGVYRENMALPDGWINITVKLPTEIAEMVKDMERKALDKLPKEDI